MVAPLNQRFLPVTQTARRIAAGLVHFSHSPQQLWGWFGGMGPDGGGVELS